MADSRAFFMFSVQLLKTCISGIVRDNKINESKMEKLIFNIKEHRKSPEWPFFNERVHYFKEITSKEMSIKRLQEILEADQPYNIVDVILSKNINASTENIISKSYKVKKMKNCFNANGEQLYAWMYKLNNGEFKNIEFGTIQEFETIVSKNITIKISEL